VLKRLRPMSSQDLTADDSREVAGGCTKGKSSGCSCRFTTPHLTTFAVVDAGIEVAGEPSAEQLVAGVEVLGVTTTTAPLPESGGETAGPAPEGGANSLPMVLSAVAVVAAVLAVVLNRRRHSSSSSSVETSGEPSFVRENPMRMRSELTWGKGQQPVHGSNSASDVTEVI
jgi:hypothetical protein